MSDAVPECPECGARLPRKGIRGWVDLVRLGNRLVECARCGRPGCCKCCVTGEPVDFAVPPMGGPAIVIPSWIHRRCKAHEDRKPADATTRQAEGKRRRE